MKKWALSTKIFLLLILVLAISSAVMVFLPQGDLVEQLGGELPASKSVMAMAVFFIIFILYGGLGFLGLILSRKLGFADLWNKKISNKQRFLNPLLIGAVLGVFFIIIDFIFLKLTSIKIPHPPFLTSIFASLSAGIGEEILFRLFFISFWTWLISSIILRKKYKNQVFWIVAIVSAIIFSFAHLPSTMAVLGFESMSQIPLLFYVEMLLLNGSVSIVGAYYFKKYGILTAIGIHFWLDIVWHVVYGVF